MMSNQRNVFLLDRKKTMVVYSVKRASELKLSNNNPRRKKEYNSFFYQLSHTTYSRYSFHINDRMNYDNDQ
ncbi:unnamed protein product [Schistosoma curassoni]|nr:unnamed protein product [Schistosoma curassoni]